MNSDFYRTEKLVEKLEEIRSCVIDVESAVAQTMEPRQWEYMLYNPVAMIDTLQERTMNAYGKQGWELVQVLTTTTGTVRLLFKRPRTGTGE